MHITPFSSTSSGAVVLPPAMVRLHDQRYGVSDLEQASETLAHAVGYLVAEQLAGRRPSLVANRHAIAILSVAGRQLQHIERRRPAKRSIAAWLRGASLSRALHGHTDDGLDI